MAWDLSTFRHVWLWQQIGGSGFPFYGRARILALEPHAAWPAEGGLRSAIEHDRALTIEPGAERRTWLTVSLFSASERPVVGVDRAGHLTEINAPRDSRGR